MPKRRLIHDRRDALVPDRDVRDAAAEDDGLEVEGVDAIRKELAHDPAGVLEDPPGGRLARFRPGEDLVRRQGLSGELGVAAAEAGPGKIGLAAASPPAFAKPAIDGDRHVADLAGVAVRPAMEPVPEDKPRAHARAQDDGHDRGKAPVALGEELGQGQAVGVVFDDERDGELRPEQADEPGLFVERRMRRAVHDVVRGAVGPRRAHAHGFIAGPGRGFGDELEDVPHDLLAAEAGLGRPALAGQDRPRFVDEAGFDLRPSEVDADGTAAHSGNSGAILCASARESNGAGACFGVPRPICYSGEHSR